MRHQVLAATLAEKLDKSPADIMYGKGGFWIKGKGFYTLAKARRITGVTGTPRQKRDRILPYGDYATIAMINGI